MYRRIKDRYSCALPVRGSTNRTYTFGPSVMCIAPSKGMTDLQAKSR